MKIFSLLLFSFSLLMNFSVHAEVMYKGSKVIDARIVAPEEYFRVGTFAMDQEKWKKAEKCFSDLIKFYPDSEFLPNAYYLQGISLFNIGEYESANESFGNYMNSKSDLCYFEDSIYHKFLIAELFRQGYKRTPFGSRGPLKFLPAHQISLKIYDEVIAALPNHDLAAQSHFYKATLLWKLHDFKESIDSFQTLTRRFPKHELTPEAYVSIGKVYLDQSRSEFQNPDLISLAEVNLKKFSSEFPRDERTQQVEEEIGKMKEVYARGLYNTALFYQRTFKNKSSIIYYENAIRQYPNTEVARLCKERLTEFAPIILARIEKSLIEENSSKGSGQFDLPALENFCDIDFESLALPSGQIDFN